MAPRNLTMNRIPADEALRECSLEDMVLSISGNDTMAIVDVMA